MHFPHLKKVTSRHSFHRSHIFWVNRSLPLWGLQVTYTFVYPCIAGFIPISQRNTTGEKCSILKMSSFYCLIKHDAHFRQTRSLVSSCLLEPCVLSWELVVGIGLRSLSRAWRKPKSACVFSANHSCNQLSKCLLRNSWKINQGLYPNVLFPSMSLVSGMCENLNK